VLVTGCQRSRKSRPFLGDPQRTTGTTEFQDIPLDTLRRKGLSLISRRSPRPVGVMFAHSVTALPEYGVADVADPFDTSHTHVCDFCLSLGPTIMRAISCHSKGQFRPWSIAVLNETDSYMSHAKRAHPGLVPRDCRAGVRKYVFGRGPPRQDESEVSIPCYTWPLLYGAVGGWRSPTPQAGLSTSCAGTGCQRSRKPRPLL
jgi:hypothetical protein